METADQIEVTDVSVTRVPVWALRVLRKHAQVNGQPASDASALRWSACTLATQLKREQSDIGA
jgi:hypothetical protein